MIDADTAAELNRLYWDSDESVGDIGARLDLSRRALYEALEPLPTGAPCPECGGTLVHRNRTARDRGEAECTDCAGEFALGEEPVQDEEPVMDEGPPTDDGPPADEGLSPDEYEQEDRAAAYSPLLTWSGEGRNGPLLAVALVGGIALGAVVGYLHRSN